MSSNLRALSLQSNLNLSVWSSHCEVYLKVNFYWPFLCHCIFLNSLGLPQSFQSLRLGEVLSFPEVLGLPVLGVVFHHSFRSGETCRESYQFQQNHYIFAMKQSDKFLLKVLRKHFLENGFINFYLLCKPQLLRTSLIPAPVSLWLIN